MTVTEMVNLAREERRVDDLRIFIPDENAWKPMRSVSVRISSTSKCTILDALTVPCRTLKGPTRSRIFCSILASGSTSISK